MKKRKDFIALILATLFFLALGSSAAGGEKKKTGGGRSSAKGTLVSCKSLKYTKVDEETILITEGFTYQKNRELLAPHIMGFKGAGKDNKLIPDEGSVTLTGLESAVNATWEFTKPGIAFIRDACLYKSKVEGATIQFTKEGVLVKGFAVSGKPKTKGTKKKSR